MPPLTLTPTNHQTEPTKEMLAAVQSPSISGNHLIQWPKSGRKPLQPKNPPADSTSIITGVSTTPSKPIYCADLVEIHSPLDQSNKENVPPNYYTPVKKLEPFPVESFDSSLAEELSAIREKLERLRIDKEKTQKMLRERELVLDLQMKEILSRGEVQKQLEIEVDRLYRLQELRLSCMRILPLRSLRDKEKEKKTNQEKLKDNNKTEDTAETKDEFESPSMQSPSLNDCSEN